LPQTKSALLALGSAISAGVLHNPARGGLLPEEQR
jgi:hypothetical protein